MLDALPRARPAAKSATAPGLASAPPALQGAQLLAGPNGPPLVVKAQGPDAVPEPASTEAGAAADTAGRRTRRRRRRRRSFPGPA